VCLLDACAHGKNTGLHILLVCVFVSHLRGRQWELPCCLLRQYLYLCTSTASKSSTCCFSPTLLHDLVVECAHSSKKVDEEQSRGRGKERESERTKRCAHSSKKELKVDAEAKRKQERGNQRERLRCKECKKAKKKAYAPEIRRLLKRATSPHVS
jgi:hypothetical protein